MLQSTSYKLNEKFKKETLKSFTVIEILVVVAIVTILVSMGVWAFWTFQKESDLNNTAEEIVNTLRLAQSKTLASEGASRYGVYFNDTIPPHKYTLFKGDSYPGTDYDVKELPEAVEIYEINLGGGSEVVFNRLTGKSSQSGNLKIRLINDPLKTKIVYIETSGLVAFFASSPPANGRIQDSRHTHFDLGWPIQDATQLKFEFPDVSQIETVDMVDYFNPTKTEFDWSGTFSIASVDQVFRVHTHLLDLFNFPYTRLCIHRDRNQGKTDQKVIIYIVDGTDKDIAEYLADAEDTVNVKTFGGTMEVQ